MDMKYYVVADVHGFYTPLTESLKEKGFFEDEGPHKLVVCGDLFDRGKEADKLQSFVVDLMKKDEIVLVKGNHEDLMQDMIDNFMSYFAYGIEYTHHAQNGTFDTALQLTRLGKAAVREAPYMFTALMRRTPFFREILPAMKNFYETEHHVFVHGWIPCARSGREGHYDYSPLSDWRNATEEAWSEARWYNGMDAARTVKVPDKRVICGHWHCSYGHWRYEGKGNEFGEGADFSPYYGDGIIAIDGCTAYTKKVNCLVVEDRPSEL